MNRIFKDSGISRSIYRHTFRYTTAGALLIAIGLIGCDRNLQKVFSADPKAISTATPSSTVSIASVSPAVSSPSPTGQKQPVPAALAPYVDAVIQLGAFGNSEQFQKNFMPNEPISRATFAQWLVTVNNRMYRDRPSRQIRLAVGSSPAFQDVPTGHPDFAAIQGLAESGYVPSPLTGDKAQTRFRPNDLLTRETLLLWKVPVERQQILPTVSADRVKQLWGFKDANRIAAPALSAVAADFKNGDLSNIRRLLGSTLLFQPQKTVTQAEAIAALWFIGNEGENLSAQDLLRSDQQIQSQTSPQSPDSSPAESPTESPTPSALPSLETQQPTPQ